MADRPGWEGAAEAELRQLGCELDVPAAADPTGAVRRRLTVAAARQARGTARPGPWRLARRTALAMAAVLAVLVTFLVATPQGRAVISHVLRFEGIELRQGPGPAPRRHPRLPGERRMPLAAARRHVSFPILVPAALGRPDQVVVSDRGRVVTLSYRRARYGQLRLDEFAGHLDPVYFQKFVHFSNVTQVTVDGARALWVRGPQVLVYIGRDGRETAASPSLTTGNTLIWGHGQVALRLAGRLSEDQALAIARSAR